MKDKKYDDFFDEKTEQNSSEEKLMALIDQYDKPIRQDIDVGISVKGTIQNIGSEYAFIDIGAKNEAMMNKQELADKNGNINASAGDTIEAYVVSNSNNEITLSRSLGGHKTHISEVAKAHKNKIPVRGKITGVNKGGFNVNIMGHRAFCPISHIDTKYVDNPNEYLSKSYSFVISRFSEGGHTIVVSRLPLLDKQLEQRCSELAAIAEKKQIIKATITRTADFGLFADVGGLEALVHISEVSWDRAEKLNETFHVGQTIECAVLKVEQRKPVRDSKISLSIKQASADPWQNLHQKLSPGQSLNGTITRLAKFGAFVQLMPGIEGLIHISEMSWAGRVRHPGDIVQEGQQVRVTVLSVDEDKRSVSCTLKDISNDPWADAENKYPAGSRISGMVESKTRYGYFINISQGVTGLLVYSNISEEKKKQIKPGKTIEVEIESVDIERRRISLSCGIMHESQGGENAQKYMDEQNQQSAPSSEFGEKLKQALAKQ